MLTEKSNLLTASGMLKEAFSLLGLDCTSADMEDTPLRFAKHIKEISRNQGKLPKTTTD